MANKVVNHLIKKIYIIVFLFILC